MSTGIDIGIEIGANREAFDNDPDFDWARSCRTAII